MRVLIVTLSEEQDDLALFIPLLLLPGGWWWLELVAFRSLKLTTPMHYLGGPTTTPSFLVCVFVALCHAKEAFGDPLLAHVL